MGAKEYRFQAKSDKQKSDPKMISSDNTTQDSTILDKRITYLQSRGKPTLFELGFSSGLLLEFFKVLFVSTASTLSFMMILLTQRTVIQLISGMLVYLSILPS